MTSLLTLKETKEVKNFIVDTLRNFKEDVRSVASKISAQDILPANQSLFDPAALSTSVAGPALVLSVGLPLIGVYLAKKKHDSPLARKIARFLNADVNSINEQFVFDKLNNPEYYSELKKNVLTVITERGDISPLTKMLNLTEGEAWEIFNTMKEIIFSAEVLKQFSIIVPSLEHIEKEVGNVRNNLNSLLEALKSPIKVSSDVGNIISELRVHESAGVSYVHREEDSELEQAILNNDNKIILIIGGPGSGKSKMLNNALMYCREYFSTFMLIKNYFREGDEKSLDLALSDNDNFVIVWDNLHEKEPKFVSNVIERINSIGRSKNFRFISASRKDIVFVREEGVYRVNLHRFDNVAELANECAKAFNVKLKPDVTADKILSKGDGTPYYTISLFKMFKDSEITLEILNQLPSEVTALWRNFLEITYQDPTIYANQLNAFRSIGLLSHASSEPSQITNSKVREVYSRVFHGDLGALDYALDNLVENMIVSCVDVGYYHAHDSHIEALETKYPLETHHVQDFTKYENDIRNLSTLGHWVSFNRREIDFNYVDIIFSRIIEIEPNDGNAWNNKGLALDSLGRHEEAISCYDKALEINSGYIEALKLTHRSAWNNKGVALYGLGKNEEAISCYDKALEINPDGADAWATKGAALFDLERYEEAIECYDKALTLKPNDGDVWYYKGLALSGLGKNEEAIECYDKALTLKPNDGDVWYYKGLALGNLGEGEEAIKYFDKALEIEPNDANAWYKRACFKVKKGDVENGLADLKKAIKIDKEYIELAKQEKDFESIRNDERFKTLVMQ